LKPSKPIALTKKFLNVVHFCLCGNLNQTAMKYLITSLSLFVIACVTCVQQRYLTTYQQLKEFEGMYQYLNGSTLKIAASPKDTLLYAIINSSKYPLKPAADDLFLNTSNDRVVFIRNTAGKIRGYALGKDTFNLLSHDVHFPASMWFPRPGVSNFTYQYAQPVQLDDGLSTSNLASSGLDVSLLTNMMDKVVDGTYPNVHSILIIKDGKLVFEEYFYQYTRDSVHELRSATKSFVSALAGIALDKQFIKSKTEPVLSYFPEYTLGNNSDAKKKITIENLLTNQSGFDCDISNDASKGNETKMGYSNDWVKFTLDLPMIDTPGGKGMYCSGNVIVAGRIIEKATGMPLPQFAEKYLFTPMGIKQYYWKFKPDPSSAEDFCQVYLRPRDMAKFGLLYLNKGKWQGKQLISEDWINASLSKHSTIQGVQYGYLWWIKYLDADGVRYYGKAAQGNGGQKIYIWEDLNLITVITGGNYNQQSPSDEIIRKHILPAFNHHKK
jgi:CubicO group peptidase (beta-lactamase class C family)